MLLDFDIYIYFIHVNITSYIDITENVINYHSIITNLSNSEFLIDD